MRYILFIGVLICQMQINFAQTSAKIIYSSADSIVINPERGFDRYTQTFSSGPTPLDSTTLNQFRRQGFTLIYRDVYLDEYKTGDISPIFLASLSNDFALMRSSGIKVALRFAYTDNSSVDAPINIVLRHIQQLTPLLQQNSDVILALQTGFIGEWGEGYYTDYYGTPPFDSTQWSWRSQIVAAEMEALPKNRMIQVRYVSYIYALANDTTPIQPSEAYSGTLKARLGNHNDCFLADATDEGTYSNEALSSNLSYNNEVTYNRSYLSRDSKYMITGGETCQVDSPYTSCPNALSDMALMHWTYLNYDYFPGVYTGWTQQGCMNEIMMNMGYRYRLLYSQIQDTSKADGIFNATIKLINDGYANPANPRIVQLVLRNKNTKQEFYLNYNQDIRLANLNDTIALSFTSGLPQGIPAGTYYVFLDMPDPEVRLYDNPLFSIRMANNNIWESTTGYNKLNDSIVVNNSTNVPVYNGTQIFAPKTKALATTLYPNPIKCNVYSNNIMLYWGENNSNYYQVLQRAQGNGPYNTIATLYPGIISYTDNNLLASTSYKYRLYLTNNDTITQTDSITTVTGNGSRYFIPINSNDSINDWSAISPAAAIYNNNDTTLAIRCFNKTDSMYFLTENMKNPRIYLQTDSSGIQSGSFSGYLFNYMISGDTLYDVKNNAWAFVKIIEVVSNSNMIKYAVSFNDISVFTSRVDYILGVVSGSRVLPDTGTALVSRIYFPTAPTNFSVTYNPYFPSSSLFVYWKSVYGATSYIYEKSDGNTSNFIEDQEIQTTGNETYGPYGDFNLTQGIRYYYRICAVRGFMKSAYSDTISDVTSAQSIKIASVPGLKVYPNPINRNQELQIELTPGDTYKILLVNLYGKEIFIISGITNNTTIPLSNYYLSAGTYFLKIEDVTNLTRSVTKLIVF